jgi:hypothetical protein
MATAYSVYSNVIGKGDFEIKSKIESTGWILRDCDLKINACASIGKTYPFKLKMWHGLTSTKDKVSNIEIRFEVNPGVHVQWTLLMTRKKDNSPIIQQGEIRISNAFSL